MKCSYSSYVNERLSYPFCLSIFFSFAGFLNSGPYLAHTYIFIYIYIYIYFCCEQCCPFKFPNLAVIFKHSRRFINFIPFLMVDLSLPFVPALMTWVFKRESLCNPNTNSFFLPKTPFSFSFSSPLPLPQTTPFVFSDQIPAQWRRRKARAPLTIKEKRYLHFSCHAWCRQGGRVF